MKRNREKENSLIEHLRLNDEMLKRHGVYRTETGELKCDNEEYALLVQSLKCPFTLRGMLDSMETLGKYGFPDFSKHPGYIPKDSGEKSGKEESASSPKEIEAIESKSRSFMNDPL
jgi:hypothetical protein